jgi:hypothetical protein
VSVACEGGRIQVHRHGLQLVAAGGCGAI